MEVRYQLIGPHGELYERTLETSKRPVEDRPVGLGEYGVPPSMHARRVYETEDGRPPICQVKIDDLHLLVRIAQIGGWGTLAAAA